MLHILFIYCHYNFNVNHLGPSVIQRAIKTSILFCVNKVKDLRAYSTLLSVMINCDQLLFV